MNQLHGTESRKYNCGCRTGKSCFQSYDLAQGELKKFRRHRRSAKRDGHFLSVYRCDLGNCKCWHVGNSPKNHERQK